MNNYISIYSDNFELFIAVNDDLTPNAEAQGWMSPIGSILSWDNLEYFTDYATDKAKRAETKQELKEAAIWRKGMNKEIIALIEKAKKLNLL